ncbi:MAG TPA: hypothetical protein VN457_04490, partial [Chlamydiales bacterium]|nr:hypothetical protein [Chlamydiales bacterium]
GTVGGTLLDQIEASREKMKKEFAIDIRVVGIVTSRVMCFNPQGISTKDWRRTLEHSPKVSWNKVIDQLVVIGVGGKAPVFVDCTSSQLIADSYADILDLGISVVAANKKANSGSMEYYKKLKHSCNTTGARFFYDTNVGAGLPIITTLQGIQRSGDEIIKVEAILSGALSYLFNSFQKDVVFSELVADAQLKGYTEPDPRDDLGGMDVKRKLLIVLRELGLPLELNDLELRPFIPKFCFDAPTVADFYTQLKICDLALADCRDKIEAKKKRLRYIASFENGKALVALQAVCEDHPFYALSGNDNIIAITTKYYSKNPIVIRGPGAGAEVTAAKVLDGIVRAGIKQ